jgi:hypothetical protein
MSVRFGRLIASLAVAAAFAGAAPSAFAVVTLSQNPLLPTVLGSATSLTGTAAFTGTNPISTNFFFTFSEPMANVTLRAQQWLSNAVFNFSSLTASVPGIGSVTFSSPLGAPVSGATESFSGLFAAGPYQLTVSGTPNGGFGGVGTVDVITTPVPEPHEWAMMLAGLGLVGWAARRRKKDDSGAGLVPA